MRLSDFQVKQKEHDILFNSQLEMYVKLSYYSWSHRRFDSIFNIIIKVGLGEEVIQPFEG